MCIIINNINKIYNYINNNAPIIVVKKFFNHRDCTKIVNICHKNFVFDVNRKKNKSLYFNFASLDVLPQNVKTDRIFRTFELSNYFIKKFKKINEVLRFQNKILKTDKRKKIYRKVQVIHYPRGGGFFGKHQHPRYPTNYGLIINLTKKNRDFRKGVTNFEIKKKKISLEKKNISIGDLIMFRYDLPHQVTPCDPNNDLTFDRKGRWTMIFPVYHEKFY